MSHETYPIPERTVLPLEERVLTEVDHFLDNRNADGSYDPATYQDILTNLVTATQEAAMPYAVTTTRHEQAELEGAGRTFMWLGRTAVQAAMSGYGYHFAPEALARVDVEVDEARHAEKDLRPGVMKLFISPRMSTQDAPQHIAKQEHLADDDAVRASWLEQSEDGKTERVMQSLLVRDVPLDAWVAMLADKNNIFKKSITVDDPHSALAVMHQHRELELPLGDLPGGPVGLVEAVVPYIRDTAKRRSVHEQIRLFKGDQTEMLRTAESIAQRWLSFEEQLAESVHTGQATYEVKRFIIGLQDYWGDEDLAIIEAHRTSNAGYRMTRKLATVIERAKQNTLWSSAALATENKGVIGQVDEAVARQIKDNEVLIQMAIANNMDYQHLEMENTRLAASQNIEVGGGCTGENKGKFKNGSNDPGDALQTAEAEEGDDRANWKWKKGVCVVDKCSTRPGQTMVGPCSVCEKCQSMFDRGQDPTKNTKPLAAVATKKMFAVSEKPNKASQHVKDLVAA